MNKRSRTGRVPRHPIRPAPLTLERMRSRWWNPDDPRLFTPKAYGWGYDLDLARVIGRERKP